MSQNSIVLPTVGVFSGLQEQDYINNALDTLNTNWSGASAPSSPETYQFWVDTNVTPNTLNMYDGTSWVTIGSLNTTAHTWTTVVPLNYLSGFTLAYGNTTTLDIAVGQASDSTNTVSISLASAFTKTTGGVWVAGSGNHAMGNGLTIANNTWYHVFAIINAGVTDIYFDTSVTAANAPAGTTAFRRVGSFKTGPSTAPIIAFWQVGDEFGWVTPVADVNVSNLGTSVATYGLTVPTMINVTARFRASAYVASGEVGVVLYPPAETGTTVDYTPVGNRSLTGPASGVPGSGDFLIVTNTSAQINAVSSAANTTLQIATHGWYDLRGKS